MDNLSPFESLEPEVQSLIMCYISSATTLYSLIRASPRYFQVFRSRRDYQLTALAVRHSLVPTNVWAVRASKLPTPQSREDVKVFTDTLDDQGFNIPQLPPDLSMPMIRLNAHLEWFVADFAKESLAILARLGEMMNLHLDGDLVFSELSVVEELRIARALCRFDTFHSLFPPRSGNGDGWYREELRPCADFLESYDYDEVEEIACITDYIRRRLWRIFDLVEDDFVSGDIAGMGHGTPQASRGNDEDWFGTDGKLSNEMYLESLVSRGLPFLRKLFTADPLRQAEMVINNSQEYSGGIEDTFGLLGRDPSFLGWPERNGYYYSSSYQDSVEEPSMGWHCASEGCAPGSDTNKGLRDWGYVFWDKRRLTAVIDIGS
ncbi:hypothetical protein G7Y79_00081g100710 [Physcia stellaris]|nr:hypothetical protein G7Y79_00081g100710 [Physcia stellaris]